MIDTFSLLLMHGLIFMACFRLLGRDDLDDENGGNKLDFLGRPRAKSSEASPPDA